VRTGWLEEPSCQNCHTGTATQNSGAIRFTTAFDDTGALRTPASDLFATTPDVPATGFSLYRFSTGHGGLQCAACHGPPHAIYPTGFANDNVQMENLQGHEGTLIECSTCHTSLEDDEIQGPHGMHPVGTKWVRDLHGGRADGQGVNQCRACHGADDRGTVLSAVQAERTIDTGEFGIKDYWRGFRIGCYDCHDGPDGENPTSNRRPVVADRNLAGPSDQDLSLVLGGSDPDGDSLELRIVRQPDHGTVALDGSVATYRSRDGVLDADTFTYAASDGKTDSNLATVTVQVDPPECGGSIVEYGFSCAGDGGFLPRLSMSGCPRPGELLTLTLDDAHGGSVALFLAGLEQAAVDLGHGCVLRVDPGLLLPPVLPIAGSGPGNGTLALAGALDPAFAGLTLTFQMFVYEPSLPGHWATTNGVEVNVE
jgi:hypothetical protein